MSRYHSYINSAEKIITGYDGSLPLANALKAFFQANKQMGGRDRKIVSNLCYCYYRCYFLIKDLTISEGLIKSLFYCSEMESDLLAALAPDMDTQIGLNILSKLKLHDKLPADIFPFLDELSLELNKDGFALSMLRQPDLYLRVRPGRMLEVEAALDKSGLDYELEGLTVQLSNSARINDILRLNYDAVVQDYNSQKVLDYLDDCKLPGPTISLWDCCAASGGKAILAADKIGKGMQLTVSDIRKSILLNLEHRLAEAEVPVKRAFVTDLSQPYTSNETYDLVIADVPCSGSGTWARTPEQIAFFTKEKLEHYSNLQRKITLNAAGAVKPGGLLFYITCSVFKKENEDVVNTIIAKGGFKILHMQYLEGYSRKADSLFVAVLETRGN